MTLPLKSLFQLPDGMIYLDGNSLGPLPCGVSDAVKACVEDQWKNQLIKGWNDCGWMEQPERVGNLIAPLIGAQSNSVVCGDTLSLKVFQALSAALQMNPERKIILSDTGNFPTDLYMAEGLIKLKAAGIELKLVEPGQINDALDSTVAAVLLTEVDYRTGKRYNMPQLTQAAHAVGAVAIWDLAHSAGAVDVDVAASGCEFAIGCTYKYLNAGPGAPAFIYVRPDLIDTIDPALSGWLGHQSPFSFNLTYQPVSGIGRFRIGTPPVLQMAALEAALKVWENTSITEIRHASIRLTSLFIDEVESRCDQLTLVSPRDSAERGSQVSFAFEHGYAAIQALIDRGIIGDFRAPDIMRFGFTPLFIDDSDVVGAAESLAEVVNERIWDQPVYHRRKAVT